MKFIHLSDLHLGKRVNEFSMIEEQEHIIKQIISVADEIKIDGIMIAGDVYDKSVPSAEAVQLFDGFLSSLAQRRIKTFIISGNHDSPERIAFGSKIMGISGIYLSPVYDGNVTPIELEDEFGRLNVYMLPFVKPSHVKRFYQEENIESYTDAISVAISKMSVNKLERNLLITHQFVTGALRSESEETVGGTDNVDASVFEDFDYVALGHLHRAQSCLKETIRYAGTPLKYSFSEAKDIKSLTVVEIKGKNEDVIIQTIPLTPLHDMSEIKGTFMQLTSTSFYENNPVTDHYLRITLTDENDVPNAMARLRSIYKYTMNLRYDNKRTRENSIIDADNCNEKKTTYQLFEEFYKAQNNSDMTKEQSEYVKKLIEKAEEDAL